MSLYAIIPVTSRSEIEKLPAEMVRGCQGCNIRSGKQGMPYTRWVTIRSCPHCATKYFPHADPTRITDSKLLGVRVILFMSSQTFKVRGYSRTRRYPNISRNKFLVQILQLVPLVAITLLWPILHTRDERFD